MKDLLFLLSILLNLLGVYYISKSLFIKIVSFSWLFKNLSKFPLLYRIIGHMMGVSEDSSLDRAFPYIKRFAEKIKNPNSDKKEGLKRNYNKFDPLKGFLLIALASIIQIVAVIFF